MTALLRILLIALVFQSGLGTPIAADSGGWFEQGCDAAIFHVTTVERSSAIQELVLTLRTNAGGSVGAYVGPNWWDVESQRCSAPDTCEHPIKARIRLDRATGRGNRISGMYSVDLPSGAHLEGQFTVKYRKPKNSIICE
jgi:hypothetical protein